MRSAYKNKLSRCLLLSLPAALVLVVVLTGLAGPAEAARPPVGRTYYAVAMGLDAGYGLQSQCFEFHKERLCTLDGLICGSWKPTDGFGREMGVSFDLTTVTDGELMQLGGIGRLDSRGKGSSIAGTGYFESVATGDGAANFSFVAREVGKARCVDLLEDSPDGGDGPIIVGSGNLVTEEREVSDFHGLVASGIGEIEIRHGASESLRITASDNILPILTTEVRDGLLVLGATGRFRTHDNNIDNIRYEIIVREFDEITLAGVFGVEVSGVDTDRLDVNVSGVSGVTVAGRADHQEVVVAGVSRYDARDLSSRTVGITLTGPSSAVVRVRDALEGSVTGGGTLEYFGNPTVNVTVDFVSTLRKIG